MPATANLVVSESPLELVVEDNVFDVSPGTHNICERWQNEWVPGTQLHN